LVDKLADFFQTNYGVDPRASRRVDMKYELFRNQQRLEIPGILKYSIEPTPGSILSETVRKYLYGWLLKPEQWRTRAVSYRPSGEGQLEEYKRTNSLVAEFRLTPSDLQLAQAGFSPPLIPLRWEWSGLTHPPFRTACGSTELRLPAR